MPVKTKLFATIIIALASVLAGLIYWYYYVSFQPYIKQISTRANNGHLTLNKTETAWYHRLSAKQRQRFHLQLKQKVNWPEVTQLKIPQKMAQDWANQNHLLSQWYLSNHSESQFEQHFWLKKLAGNKQALQYAAKASFKLAQLNQQSAPLDANNWYQKALALSQNQNESKSESQYENLQFEYAKFLIEQGEPESQWSHLLYNNSLAHDYRQTELATFKYDFAHVLQSLSQPNAESENVANIPTQCTKPIQILASTYQQLQIVKHSLQSLLELDFFADSGFCISGQHWSKHIPMQTPEIQAQPLQNLYWLIESPQLLRAYRQGQFIFMPKQLNSQVMGHELAHWLGLEDEYLLSEEKAKQRCTLSQSQFGKKLGHNLVVIKPDYYFQSQQTLLTWMEHNVPWFAYIKHKKNWIIKEKAGYRLKYQLTGDLVGFYPTPTCNKLDLISLKPMSRASFMQNHAFYIPKLYKELILL